MNISSLLSPITSLIGNLNPTTAANPVSSITDTDGDMDGSGSSASSTSSASSSLTSTVSPFAQILNQLQGLSQSNPAEFKSVMSEISGKLSAVAQTAGGSQGQALSNLAAKFQQASQTGTLAPLTHHHVHAKGAAALYAHANSSASNNSSSIAAEINSIISQTLNQATGNTGSSTSSGISSLSGVMPTAVL